MTNPVEIMLDIETIGLTPNAAVWQIAARRFDKGSDGSPAYVAYTDPTFILHGGFEIDESTIEWLRTTAGTQTPFENWLNKKLAYETVAEIYYELRDMGGNASEHTIWWAKNGAFDFPILENLFAKCKLAPPWNRRNKACMYTLRIETERILRIRGAVFPELAKSAQAHDAEVDVNIQIKNLRAMRKATDGCLA